MTCRAHRLRQTPMIRPNTVSHSITQWMVRVPMDISDIMFTAVNRTDINTPVHWQSLTIDIYKMFCVLVQVLSVCGVQSERL